MKRDLIIINLILIPFILISAACSEPTANKITAKSEKEPTGEIEQAVREYYSKPRQSGIYSANNTPIPPAKLIGVTLKKYNNTFYVVGADVEYSGVNRKIEQVICRQFSGQGKTYWQAEPFDPYKVKQFGSGN